VEHDAGEISRRDILQPSHLNYIFDTGKNIKGGHALRKQFGKTWDDWAERVPYSVFPGIY
jgi:hypothetical protein